MESKADRRMAAASISDVGKVREHNEDACLTDVAHGLFIVADGMGGAQAGALASEIVVRVLPEMIEEGIAGLKKPTGDSVRRAIRNTILALGQEIQAESAEQAGLKGMGATVVLSLIRGRWAHIAHMGDSRAYLFRDGRLTRLTEDHSIVGILLRNGEITPEEAKTHPARGRLSRYVGMESEVYPDVRTEGLRKSDRLLLCTDGVVGMISDADIQGILEANPEPQQACQALVHAANQAGGEDNITALVINWK